MGALHLSPRPWALGRRRGRPELRLLHRWLDSWRGIGDIVGVIRRVADWNNVPKRLDSIGDGEVIRPMKPWFGLALICF